VKFRKRDTAYGGIVEAHTAKPRCGKVDRHVGQRMHPYITVPRRQHKMSTLLAARAERRIRGSYAVQARPEGCDHPDRLELLVRRR
jgi:hypothetical protein